MANNLSRGGFLKCLEPNFSAKLKTRTILQSSDAYNNQLKLLTYVTHFPKSCISSVDHTNESAGSDLFVW